MTSRNPEPRRCCVCDRRAKSGEDFHAHEDACINAEQESRLGKANADERFEAEAEARELAAMERDDAA